MPYYQIAPDNKDWTFVITEGCTQCSFKPFPADETSSRIFVTAEYYERALGHPSVSVRPSDGVWSPLEYSCHVRDVFAIFDERLSKMLQFDNPEFENWDQDKAAIENDYEHQNPKAVLLELRRNADKLSNAFAAVSGDQWRNRGLRSNGSHFTIETFAIYLVHDIEHHIADIEAQLHLK